jgi:hypothetical protein
MGLFWDLLQQRQISDAKQHADTLEARVADLERELEETRRVLHEVIRRLEEAMGKDLDRDGRIG